MSAQLEKDPDPLLECLLVIAAHHGTSATRESLRAGLPVTDDPLTPSLFVRAARRVGLIASISRVTLDRVESGLLPAVLLLRDDMACILTSVEREAGRAFVIYPDLSEVVVEVSLEELAERFTGRCLFVRPRHHFDARSQRLRPERSERWFWDLFRANLRVYRDVLTAAALVNVFALSMPLFTMNVYDRVVPNHAVETLWVLAAGISIVLLGDAILRTMRAYFLDVASRRIDVGMSASLMEKVLGLRLEAKPDSAGSFASNIRSFETVRDFITSATMATLIDLPFTILFAGVILWIAWPLVIPLLIGIGIVIGYALGTQRRMRKLSETTFRAGAQRNSILIEALVGLETLKLLGAEGRMQRRWEQSAAFLARTAVKLRLLSTGNVSVTVWVQQLVSVAVVVLGVYRITDGLLSMGGLIACSMLSSRALAPLGQLSGLLVQYHSAATALTSLNDIMAKPMERPIGAHFVSRPALAGSIEFRNVSFSYPQGNLEVLRGLSFRIEPGERVAILGRVGSGKTTLQKLMTGIYHATEGAVLVDGIDVRQLDPAELRRQIGSVPQDGVLFYGTLRDNLVVSDPSASDEAVLRVAELACLTEFVNTHPHGFDLVVGERGESLSGGQRRCVMLARALIHDPPILLLDEPTSSMDHSTESAVRANLARYSRGKTLVVVTHRTSLLDLVDRVIVMDAGRFVADGPKASVVDALRQRRISRAV